MRKNQNLKILKNLKNIFMQNKKENFKYSSAINFALKKAMTVDKNLICYGLGVNDPKNI